MRRAAYRGRPGEMNRVEEATAPGPAWSTALAAALVVVCGLAAYSNGFTDLFVGLDGKQSIRDNPHIGHVWPLSEALSLPMWEAPENVDEMPTVAHRPTFSLSLALTNHFLGDEPPAHHAVNLAIHIAAALVLFGIVRRTANAQCFRERSSEAVTWLALATALIWLVHPLQTESVTYIVQRAESLMGLLFLLTLYCAIRAVDGRRRLLWQTGAVAACLLGTGCKQTVLLAPVLVVLHDYTFVSRSGRRWSRPIFYLAMVAAAVGMLLSQAGDFGTYFEPVRSLYYLLAQPAVILHYLRLTLWPDELFLYVNTSLFQVRSITDVLVPAAILVGLFVATIRCITLRNWLGFVGAWFFLTLAPASSVIPISDVIQEHRMYLPLAALALLAAVGGEWAVGKVVPGSWGRGRTVVAAVLLAVVVAGLGVRTRVRNLDYHREFTMVHPADLHEDYTILADHYLSADGLIQAEASRARERLRSSSRDPRDVPFAHFIIGLAHARGGELQDAAAELQRVVELEPGFAYAHYQLGQVLRDLDDQPGAIRHFEDVVRIKPEWVHAYKDLAVALKATGDTAGAEERLEMALRVPQRFGRSHVAQGMKALERDDAEQAATYFQQAVRYRPDLVELHYELAVILMARGDVDRAREHLAMAVRLRPEFAEARRELGMALYEDGDLEGAAEHVAEAVRLRPDLAEAHNDLGIVASARGDYRGAAEHFQAAIGLRSDFAAAHRELGMALFADDDLAGAVEHVAEAVRLEPGVAEARNDLGIVLGARGESRAAAKQFHEAIRLRPDFAAPYYELAVVLAERGEDARAREHLATAIRLKPEFAEAHRRLGMMLFEDDDLAGAAEHVAEAVRIRPEVAEAHNDLGIVLSARGDPRAAAVHFQRAIRLRPDFAEAHYELALLARDEHDLERATAQLQRAVRLEPDFAQAHLDLSLVLRERGDEAGAAEHLRRAREIDPDLVEANEAQR